MTEIVEGNSYVAREIKVGSSKNGEYEILTVKGAGKRQPLIGISVLNPPSGIGVNGAFRVEKIHSVMVRNWQDSKGVWHTGGSVTVRAEVSPVYGFDHLVGGKPINNEATKFPGLEDLFL